MVSLNTILFVLTAALARLNLASVNEASSISEAMVYKKVRLRVRDIVGMLQSMQDQVMKDGEDEADLFGKYMFYCRRGRTAMEASIHEAESTDLDGLKSTIEGEQETQEDIKQDIAEDQAKRADAERAIEKAKELREYERKIFEQESSKIRQDITGLKHAIGDVDKGKGLQKSTVPLLRRLSGWMDVRKEDRELLKGFLQHVSSGDPTVSQEIRDILGHMLEVVKGKLSELVKEENIEKTSFQDYKDMIRQKSHALRNGIEKKTSEAEELEEEVNSQKDTLEDAARYLMEGPAFLPFVTDSENCTRREEEWAQRCHIRTAEMSAIAGTITAMTDDTLLDELLRKSLPKPWQEVNHHAIRASKQSNQKTAGKFSLVALALKGKNASFTKIFQVIDGVASMLGKDEQATDHEKYCGQSVNETEESLKRLTLSVSGLGTIIAQHEKTIANLTTEMDEVHDGIRKLDQEIVDGAKVRQADYQNNAETLTSDNMTLHLFQAGRDRLSKFYHEEVPIDNTTDVPLAEIIGHYQKKHDDCNDVIELLDKTLQELTSEISKVEEKENRDQSAWETAVRASLEKHARDMKFISGKQAAKANLEASLVNVSKEKSEKMQEVKASAKYLAELQGNHTGFLRPSLETKCARKATQKTIDTALSKNFLLWS